MQKTRFFFSTVCDNNVRRPVAFLQVLFGVVLLLLSWVIQAVEEQPQRTVNVVTELYVPFQILSADNTISGYATDVVKAVFDAAEISYDIELNNWAKVYRKALQEPNVAIFSIARNSYREDKFFWVAHLYTEKVYFWSLKDANIPVTNRLSDLYNYVIPAIKDMHSHEELLQRGFQNVYAFDSVTDGNHRRAELTLLIGGRVDLMLSSKFSMTTVLEEIGIPDDFLRIVYHSRYFDNQLYLAFNKDSDPVLVKAIENAFREFVAQGRLAKLRKRWQLE